MNSWEVFIDKILKDHSGEALLLLLSLLVTFSLIIIVPQLLRASMRRAEMRHLERLKSLECGIPLPCDDDRARVAGRTALLVPMVIMIAAGTVTCFLVINKSENLFPTALAIWVVAGVVSLAAITGGVALIGRLAQIQAGEEDEEEEELEQSEYK